MIKQTVQNKMFCILQDKTMLVILEFTTSVRANSNKTSDYTVHSLKAR